MGGKGKVQFSFQELKGNKVVRAKLMLVIPLAQSWLFFTQFLLYFVRLRVRVLTLDITTRYGKKTILPFSFLEYYTFSFVEKTVSAKDTKP